MLVGRDVYGVEFRSVRRMEDEVACTVVVRFTGFRVEWVESVRIL